MSEWNVGVDIVEVARFERLDFSSYRRFYERVFTPEEIEYCLSFGAPAPHFAVNFAGKEAIYKAINRYHGVKLRDIEILRDKDGAPRVNLHLSLKGQAKCGKTMGKGEDLPFEINVSLSHSSLYAVAFAAVRRSKVNK